RRGHCAGRQVAAHDARGRSRGSGGQHMSEETYRLNCFVENKPGVLARIVGLISGRGYNIQTLNVGPTEDGTVSRMRIDVLGTERVVNQIILQLRNCVNVIEVTSRRR
ncbi:MAG: acetolactate synthase small subunit, partial [Kiritimatiellae bacterium]|nr:acetolactate synthase small subunit [Kiritimatiellia bacterium]